jgi:hypothetical protein
MTVINSNASCKEFELGFGLNYTPVERIKYVGTFLTDYNIVDNVSWEGRFSYLYKDGIKGGLEFDYSGRTIHPRPFTTDDIKIWQAGAFSDYNFEIIESGKDKLLFGFETGYARLSDKYQGRTKSDGSFWITGMTGLKFKLFSKIWGEIDYRISHLQFDIVYDLHQRYIFTGSSLRVALDYQIGNKAETK